MQVKLYTHDKKFVSELEIPPFNEYPKVILWGVRVFVLMSQRPLDASYTEVFAYAAPDGPINPEMRHPKPGMELPGGEDDLVGQLRFRGSMFETPATDAWLMLHAANKIEDLKKGAGMPLISW